MQTVLTNILQGLLREPEPVLKPARTLPGAAFRDKDRVTRAAEGFYAAVRAVNESDHAAMLHDWNERQAAFTRWVTRLSVADGPAQPEHVDGTTSAENIFAEMRILTLWQARRTEESARKTQITAQCCTAVESIAAATAAKLQAARAGAQIQLASATGTDTASSRAQAAVQANLRSIRESAVERINALTRRVLDLDEYTAPVTIQQWWTRCGIDQQW